MHSNIHNEIVKHNREVWFRNNWHWLVFAIAIVFALIVAWHYTQAAQIDQKSLVKCVNAARLLNSESVLAHHSVYKCIGGVIY